MAEPFDWLRTFARLRYAHPESALRDLAAHLQHAATYGDGRTEPEVLALLAQMIDPDFAKPATGQKFVLKRLKKKSGPPKEPDYALRRFLEDAILVRGEKREAAVAEAREKFGASRSECFRQLGVVKKHRESMAELDRVTALLRLATKQG